LYVFIFGRKQMQFFNDFILSLSLDGKGFKNYGNFDRTGEKNFIKLIKKDLNFCIDIGANTGKYTNLLLSETNAKVYSFEPLPAAFRELEKLKLNFQKVRHFNTAIGLETLYQIYFMEMKI